MGSHFEAKLQNYWKEPHKVTDVIIVLEKASYRFKAISAI